MEYERTILELIERVKALEEKVDMILERQNSERENCERKNDRGTDGNEDRRSGTAGGENVRGAAAGDGKGENETSGEKKRGETAGGETREDASDSGKNVRGAAEGNGKAEDGKDKDEKGKGEKIGTAQIKAYIGSVVRSALDKGDEYIDITANQIHKALGLTRRMPTVCNAMKQCMRECDEVLRKTASGYSSTFEVRYKKDSGENG